MSLGGKEVDGIVQSAVDFQACGQAILSDLHRFFRVLETEKILTNACG
jgi:hypothetical protein